MEPLPDNVWEPSTTDKIKGVIAASVEKYFDVVGVSTCSLVNVSMG